MSSAPDIPSLTVERLIERISSTDVAPGAGGAGAVALALAAACAGKAVSISLAHSPDDAELQAARATFAQIANLALSDADRDAEAFAAFIRKRDPAAVNRLIYEGEQVARLIAALSEAIALVESRIRPNMTGDVAAARALLVAAHSIQRRNEAEVR
jgi:formiminotransferase-cyclodeaminase